MPGIPKPQSWPRSTRPILPTGPTAPSAVSLDPVSARERWVANRNDRRSALAAAARSSSNPAAVLENAERYLVWLREERTP